MQDQDGTGRLREIKEEEARDQRAPGDIRAGGRSHPGPDTTNNRSSHIFTKHPLAKNEGLC
jgi:hypothetical protein